MPNQKENNPATMLVAIDGQAVRLVVLEPGERIEDAASVWLSAQQSMDLARLLQKSAAMLVKLGAGEPS